jgi:hypothetical protein
VRRDFYARFWEMYLTCALHRTALQDTYSLSCPKPGPDILIEQNGRRIWIEAVTATDGHPNKPDSLKPPQLGEASQVPDEQIVLRHTTAINSKHDAYLRYRSKGIVAEDDAYLIAVNGYPLSYRFADPEIPRILKVVFPIGSIQYVLDRQTGDVVTTKYQFRPNVYKSNGVDVSTRIFVDDRYRGISAVLHSYANPDMALSELGADFLLVHNPLASQPLPSNLIATSAEYRAQSIDDPAQWQLVLR